MGFIGLGSLIEVVFYNVSGSENRGINRGGHVKGDHLCSSILRGGFYNASDNRE